jgi:hypothetical protein
LREKSAHVFYVQFDTWFCLVETFEHILKQVKHFVGAFKSNRLVAMSLEDKKESRFVHVSELELSDKQAVYLSRVAYSCHSNGLCSIAQTSNCVILVSKSTITCSSCLAKERNVELKFLILSTLA